MKRKNDFLLKNVAGQDFLVPLGAKVMEMNCLIALNPTGRRVWELLAEDRSLEDLAAEIAERFEVDHENALADVRAFLDDIRRLGLLET
ncbi:MAG: PqqD family protein [Desulfomonilaceae bacterium]